jgi:nitrous oxidase accessory protein
MRMPIRLTGAVRVRQHMHAVRRGIGVAVMAALVTACSIGPEPIQLGSDECAQCRMTISEPQFAAQALSTRGLSYKFDSIECLAAFLEGDALPAAELHSAWVTDFDAAGQWLPVEDAFFVHSERLRSPMGGGLGAHASRAAADAHSARLGAGHVLDWTAARRIGAAAHGDLPHHHDRAHVTGNDTGTLVVGEGERYASIAAAIAAAEPGARIVVRAGTYREAPLLVTKRVELVGEGYPVLDGEGRSEVVVVSADSVVVRGFEIRGAGVSYVADNAALRFEAANGCVAENNRLIANFFGIYLARSDGCRIAGNEIVAFGRREAASGNGIHLWNSMRATIEDNHVRGHRDGIYLEYAGEARLTGNVSRGNLRYGLHFMFSHDAEYVRNEFRENGAGVAVMYTRRVVMADNTFEDNWGPASYGLLLKEITDSEIRDNVFRRNTIAIYAEGVARIEVRRNRFLHNGWAVRIMSNSREGRFTDNDFIDNSFDVSTDSRRNFNVFDANYWSRYDGYDLTGDGFGDVPYRPVRLFSLIVQRNPATLVLLRSMFVELLDRAERVMPVLTPETLVDARPRMQEVRS